MSATTDAMAKLVLHEIPKPHARRLEEAIRLHIEELSPAMPDAIAWAIYANGRMIAAEEREKGRTP